MSIHQLVFPNSEKATHMPFFDGTTLIFCQSEAPIKKTLKNPGTIWKRIRRNKALANQFKDFPRNQEISYRPWKLAYCAWENKQARPIITGLPDNISERSPSFYKEGDRVHLSFLAGTPNFGTPWYWLYTCSGPDLEHLEAPKRLSYKPVFFGFISPHHICWGNKNLIQLTEKMSGKSLRLQTNFHRVACVTFLADDPLKLLITGLLDREHTHKTVLYDLKTESISDVLVDEPVYKSSLAGDQIVFSKIRKENFEDRELFFGKQTLSTSAIQVLKESNHGI